jgi:hypothetical protein
MLVCLKTLVMSLCWRHLTKSYNRWSVLAAYEPILCIIHASLLVLDTSAGLLDTADMRVLLLLSGGKISPLVNGFLYH